MIPARIGRLFKLLPPARLANASSTGLLLAGWLIFSMYLLLPQVIPQHFPWLAITAPNTALGLALAGLALRCRADSRWRRMLGGCVVALAMPVLAQHLSGWYPAQPALQLFLVLSPETIRAWPGSMSLLTAIGLLSGGAFLVLPENTTASSVRMGLVILVLACGLIGGIGRLLNIADLLLIEPYLSGMGPATALALILLSIGLCADGFATHGWSDYFVERLDRQLTAIGMLLMLGLGVAAGLTGIAAVVKQESDVSRRMMSNALAYDVELIDTSIGARIRLHQLAAGRSDGELDAVGLEYCERPELPALSIPLPGGKAELFWNEGLFLRTHHDRGPAAGSAICSDLSAALLNSQHAGWLSGPSYETLVCGYSADRRIMCLPTRFRMRPFLLPDHPARSELPVIRALSGLDAASIGNDYRGHPVIAAYRPSAWKLGVVQKLDLADHYAPFRRRVWAGMGIVLTLTLLGGRLLFLFARPMVAMLQRLQRSTRAIVEHAPIAIVGVDQDGTARMLNPSAETMFPDPPDPATGQTLAALLAEPSSTQLARIVEQANQRGCVSSRMRAHGRNGDFDADMHLCAYQLDGELLQIGLFSDISARLRHESELAWWKRIFQHAKWGIAVSRLDDNLLQMVNPWFAHMHGYSADELIGLPFATVFSSAAASELPGHLQRIHELGHYGFESEHRRQDGSLFPVWVDVSLVQDVRNETLYRVANVLDISERKQMEQALSERERLLRMVMDTQQEMIVRWLPDRTVVFVNQAVCRFSGRNKSQLIGRAWLEQEAGRNGGPFNALEWQHDHAGQVQPLRREREMLDGSGNRRLIAWTDTPIFDRDGQLECIQSMGLDISEERQAALALRASELRFAAIFHSMFQFTAILSPSGVLLEINDNALEIASVKRQAVLGRYFWETPWWRKNRQAQPDLQQMIQNAAQGRPARAEMEIHGTGDKRTLLELSLRPVPGSDGAIAWLIAEGRDVTRARQDSETAAAQDRRLRALSANLPGVVFQIQINPRTEAVRFAYVSQGAEELFGMGCEEMLQGRANFAAIVHGDDLPAFLDSLRHCTGRLEEWLWNGRIVNRRSAMPRWVSLRALPHPDADGSVLFDGLVLNISEVKQQESEVERSREMLRELAAHLDSVREEERKRIAREVHDELGQTLTALRMEIAMLEMETETVDQLKHARSLSMKSLVDQAIGVVRDVASSLRPVALDMGLVPALMWLASEFQQRTGVACSVELFSKQIALDDDRATVLFRIVQESLTNILRHAEARHVVITLGKVGRRYVLEVRDDGKGFDSHAAKRANAFGLLGMRERATMLGGTAEVVSEPGAGTVVKVEVPEK